MAEKLVTVYHGTTAGKREGIEREGLRQLFGRRGYVFVTTDRARALYYARAATAFAITPTNFDGYWPPKPVDLRNAPPSGDPLGLIVTAEVPMRLLKDDPYNPTNKPDQYRIYGGIRPEHIVGFEEVEFPELLDQEQRVIQFVLWTSIQRSLWTRSSGSYSSSSGRASSAASGPGSDSRWG